MSDPLLEPFALGPLMLRNRIISTSHEPAYTEDGMPADRYRAYHVEKARGGVAMSMIGGSSVIAPDSPSSFGNIDLSTDRVIPHLARIAEELHALDTPVTIQVTHLGSRTSNFTGDWLPTISPTRTREPQHRSFTKAAEDYDIERIIEQYAAAARRVAAAGLDGLELEHYGHLLDAFATPRLNARTDDYGGDFAGRARFPLRVIEAVRAAVPDLLLGVRVSVDDFSTDGMTEELAVALIREYESRGIDFLSLVVGRLDSDAALARAIPGMGTPAAPFLETCRRVRAQVNVPVLHASRIADVSTARHAVASGCLDLVGMTRAQLADPYLVTKIREGREDDIRPCVGANACLDAIYVSGSALCVHNPATGREQILPQSIEGLRAAAPKRVAIIGAGPAGLEAARICAVKGHEVTVYEAAGTYGGQVALAARSARRRDLIGIVDWRFQQARRHGVTFRFNELADERTVAEAAADVVIIATGGMPDTEFVTGPVADVWDVMTDQLPGSGPVIVYDDNGTNPALDAVERLAAAGREITYATPERMIGIDVGSMNSPAYLEVFDRAGVRTVLNSRLIAVAEEAGDTVVARLRNEYTGREFELRAQAVVAERGTLPNDELYTTLRPASGNGGRVDQQAFIAAAPQPVNGQGFALYRIGDAVSSRNIHAAILDAMRICLPL